MNVKMKAYKERELERWKERVTGGQNAPEINSNLVGFNIKMLFEYPDDDGGGLTNGFNGEVMKVVSKKKFIMFR